MNVALSRGLGRDGVQPWVRCADCSVRSFAPCGAIEDEAGLAELDRAHAPLRHIPADGAVFEQGAVSDRSYTVLRGWLALTQTSCDGRLAILRFALPGDVVGFERRSSVNTFGAVAIGEATVCSISRSRQARLELEQPRFDARHRAVQAETLEQAYEALTSTMGHRSLERVGRLLFQLASRSLRRRPSAGDGIYAPLKQIQIGLATGLTPVHVSRVMRRLREDRIVAFGTQRLTILDAAALGRLAGVVPDDTALRA